MNFFCRWQPKTPSVSVILLPSLYLLPPVPCLPSLYLPPVPLVLAANKQDTESMISLILLPPPKSVPTHPFQDNGQHLPQPPWWCCSSSDPPGSWSLGDRHTGTRPSPQYSWWSSCPNREGRSLQIKIEQTCENGHPPNNSFTLNRSLWTLDS